MKRYSIGLANPASSFQHKNQSAHPYASSQPMPEPKLLNTSALEAQP
jgi:hypothetical protein